MRVYFCRGHVADRQQRAGRVGSDLTVLDLLACASTGVSHSCARHRETERSPGKTEMDVLLASIIQPVPGSGRRSGGSTEWSWRSSLSDMSRIGEELRDIFGGKGASPRDGP